MPEVVLEAVSPFGVKHSGQETWTNQNKGLDLKLKENFHPGDAVNLELNKGGYLTGITLVTAAPPKPAFKKSFGGGSFKGGMSDERSAQMSRGAAIKTVLVSPLIDRITKDMSDEQALAESFKIADVVASYIEKGRSV